MSAAAPLVDLSPEELIGIRAAAQHDLYAFSRWMFVKRRGFLWQRARHHQIIASALMRVFRGECTRLIVNVPPRYSKSEFAINFVSWGLGHAPDSEFILTSYSGMLAENNAWLARELVQHEEYRAIFPAVMLRSDSNARGNWRTTAGGVVYAVGAGGTITGFGAGKHRDGFGGAILIDDPHKPDEARSDVVRQGVLDWFQNTLESRKNDPKRTPIVLIMQRVHESDLAGWLLEGGNGETWEHVCLPALQDDGTALWPEKHDVAMLERMAEANAYHFAGQYQQRPAPPEGLIFKPDKIEIVDVAPIGTRYVRGWDLAATATSASARDPDWLAGVKLGRMGDGRIIIADMVRTRGGPHDIESTIVNTAGRDGKACMIRLPQDPGQAGKAQVAYLTRALSGYPVQSMPVTGDKVTRAEPFASQVNVGNVLMVRAPWNDALIAELRMFPNATHDDQVDACSEAFNNLPLAGSSIASAGRRETAG